MLIAAHRGEPGLKEAALKILEDEQRVFLTSPFLELELIPKPFCFRKHAELAFLRRYVSAARKSRNIRQIITLALDEASRCGLGTLDALHLAAAHLLKADEFIITERLTKPIHRSNLVRVKPLR